MLKFRCVSIYDPCYGFNIIRPGIDVYVSETDLLSDYYLITLVDALGRTVGTIYRPTFLEKFELAVWEHEK
jgi:hypothetical protein